jgi:2OG-Fe(II) oxygenase superfamily
MKNVLNRDFRAVIQRFGCFDTRRVPIAALTAPSNEGLWIVHQGERRPISGAPQVDSGFVTVLVQAGVSGLQARAASGAWIDIPPREGALTVNFDRLLPRWTGNSIKTTEHRVLGSARERYPVPFFYEPCVDAEIAPLSDGDNFFPLLCGDYLWETIAKFLEFRGLESLRPAVRISISRWVSAKDRPKSTSATSFTGFMRVNNRRLVADWSTL